MAPALPVVRVTGAGRDAGKTWLASRLIEWFAGRGYVVAALKRSHHLMPADREGTDSHRFAEAGARHVLFCGGDGVLTRELGPADSLEQIVRALGGEADLVLVEGFRDDALGATIRIGSDADRVATLETMEGGSLLRAPTAHVGAFAEAIEREFGLSAAGDEQLRELVRRAAAAHGHVCAGIVLGVRMAQAAAAMLALPSELERHRLAVTVETTRCLTDAVASATGRTVGSGDLRVVDYGKAAATFLDRSSGRALRLLVRDEARELAAAWAPAGADERHREALAYRVMPDEALFDVREVSVDWPADGHRERVRCARCGESARAAHARRSEAGESLCAPCAEGDAYYRLGARAAGGPRTLAARNLDEAPASR
jgi:formylmethanofuran dehydrogenase subunit E